MRLDTLAFLASIALLFAMAYHASADPVDARAVVRHFGGPHVDRASIARMLRDGMREATCPSYNNSFLTRGAP